MNFYRILLALFWGALLVAGGMALMPEPDYLCLTRSGTYIISEKALTHTDGLIIVRRPDGEERAIAAQSVIECIPHED